LARLSDVDALLGRSVDRLVAADTNRSGSLSQKERKAVVGTDFALGGEGRLLDALCEFALDFAKVPTEDVIGWLGAAPENRAPLTQAQRNRVADAVRNQHATAPGIQPPRGFGKLPMVALSLPTTSFMDEREAQVFVDLEKKQPTCG
jgi:hypothetical protein